MDKFDPTPHLIELRGKKYLEVKWRLLWLRQEHPDWSITTDLVDTGDPIIMRAVVADAAGHPIATGYAEYPRGRQFPAIMKAETAAIGRALAHAGFGTQFGGQDVQEADVVDAPAGRPQQPARQQARRSSGAPPWAQR